MEILTWAFIFLSWHEKGDKLYFSIDIWDQGYDSDMFAINLKGMAIIKKSEM